MRIVQYIDTLRSGGKERQLVELLKGLSQMDGIECELIVMSEDIHYTDLYKLGITVHWMVRNRRLDPTICIRLYRLLKEMKPDILHSWSSMCSVYAVPVLQMKKIKFVNGFLRNAAPSLSWRNKEWRRAKLTFPFSDVVVANSHAGLASYQAPADKSYCIHNGFDLCRLDNLLPVKEVKKKFGIPGKFVVGMVASFSQNKDYRCIIEAALKVIEKCGDVSFVFVGDGDTLTRDKASVPDSIRKKIIFLGRQKEVENIINCFDIGVLSSSSSHGEGISNSIMEYMALGKPVVATDCGGNRELVLQGENGFLVSCGDADEFAAKMIQLLKNQTLIKRFGESGRIRIKEEFTLERFTQEHIKLYSKLLQ